MPREIKNALAYCVRSGAVALALTLLALPPRWEVWADRSAQA
jgi:hypothetical protein